MCELPTPCQLDRPNGAIPQRQKTQLHLFPLKTEFNFAPITSQQRAEIRRNIILECTVPFPSIFLLSAINR